MDSFHIHLLREICYLITKSFTRLVCQSKAESDFVLDNVFVVLFCLSISTITSIKCNWERTLMSHSIFASTNVSLNYLPFVDDRRRSRSKVFLMADSEQENLELLRSSLKLYPNFPKKGITFMYSCFFSETWSLFWFLLVIFSVPLLIQERTVLWSICSWTIWRKTKLPSMPSLDSKHVVSCSVHKLHWNYNFHSFPFESKASCRAK